MRYQRGFKEKEPQEDRLFLRLQLEFFIILPLLQAISCHHLSRSAKRRKQRGEEFNENIDASAIRVLGVAEVRLTT